MGANSSPARDEYDGAEGPFIVINKFTSLESLLSQYFPHLQYICPNMWAGTLKGSHKQLWLVQATGTYF